MAFVLPTFNLICSIRSSTSPTVERLESPCNLAAGNRVQGTGPFPMTLLLPALTDIRDDWVSVGGSDIVEVPKGTGRFYSAVWVDDCAKGFSNEYRRADIQKVTAPGTGAYWPVPIP